MKHGRRISLAVKINLLIIAAILVVAAGLVGIGYRAYGKRIDDIFVTETMRYSTALADYLNPTVLEHFQKEVMSKEYQEVRNRAEAAGDAAIAEKWMAERPGGDPSRDQSLLDDYNELAYILDYYCETYGVDEAYFQMDKDEVTWNIISAYKGFLWCGTIEIQDEVFDTYEDNTEIPPTIYYNGTGWYCTACVPVTDETGERIIGLVGVDLDVNKVMEARRWFLMNITLLVVTMTLGIIAVAMILMRRIVVHPLKRLAEGACGFAQDGKGYTKDDVIHLNIRSNDEIEDLYHEIRSMQNRIVEYTDNLTRVTAEKERVNTELRTAAEIQTSMLPHIFPPFPERKEFELYASMDPAKEVGGDFYDYFMIDDHHLALIIADVSDKGIPAALTMMASKILLNYRAHSGGTPAEIFADVNQKLCQDNKEGTFVTVWMGILDLRSGKMICSNAGHEYPEIKGKDGRFCCFKDRHGMPLGAMETARYKDYELDLSPGDGIFVYTDGVPEANDIEKKFYSLLRLEGILNTVADQDPETIIRTVRADIDEFKGEAEQFDDITMLCVSYRGSEGTA